NPKGALTLSTVGSFRLANGMRADFQMADITQHRNWKWVGPFLWLWVHYDHKFEKVEERRKGSSLACGLPTNTRRETCHIATLGQSSYETSPPKTRSSFAPDYRPFRFLRLRASGLQRLATTPHSR